MDIIRDKRALAEAIRLQRREGKTVGFIPTMGALHAGHLSLVDIAAREADAVVISIFVNPTQFAPNEDFAAYPRTEEDDLQLLAQKGVTLAYLPNATEMYPTDACTKVTVEGIRSELEGVTRPHFFDGVATVVTKLFQQVTPDVAVFGEKDYQQLHVIRQFTRDLDIPVRILGGPILREADGLAMSSRNRYLSADERPVAASLYRVLNQTAETLRAVGDMKQTLAASIQALLEAGFAKVDYLELRDAETLAPLTQLQKPARLLAAAHLGKTRLIDNIGL